MKNCDHFDAMDKDDFSAGICVALTVITGFDQGVIWGELVRCAGVNRMIHYAANVEPNEWELAGFSKYAKSELGRNKPRRKKEAK